MKVDSKKLDDVTVHVSVEMPFNILEIDSPSHSIKMKVKSFNACKFELDFCDKLVCFCRKLTQRVLCLFLATQNSTKHSCFK